MASFRDLIPRSVTVIRAGSKLKIPAEYLVVGDLVIIKSGDKVPADLRITESFNLEIENSAITGESILISKHEHRIHLNPFESENFLFSGTYVIKGIKFLFKQNSLHFYEIFKGKAQGIVIRTGQRTVISLLAIKDKNLNYNKSPLSKDVSSFLHSITYVSIFFGFLFSS
jgi:magnesium-transporting ATPase (P-type)